MSNNQFKFDKSFYDWCIENNRQDLLERWDYDLNKKTPQEIGFSSNKYWWFKCIKHPEHHSEKYKINSCTSGKGSFKCKQCNSFGQWCVDNNYTDLLDRWDYELNNKSPFEVSYMSHDKCYFKCPYGKHKSTLKQICCVVDITHGSVACDGCNSFAQWGIDNIGEDFLEIYWSNQNTVDPWEIASRANRVSIYINCLEKSYHSAYRTSPDQFVRGSRCPYCSSTKLHYMDSLGYVYPNTLDIWSEKNKKTPFEYTVQNNQSVWWKCQCGKHDDYYRQISDNVRRGFHCPGCTQESVSSILQNKVATYIKEKYNFQLLHEHKCTIRPINPKTKMPMPYDNEIPELKLIIEVNGQQHYTNHMYKSLWGLTEEDANKMLEKRQQYDKYKMDYALEHRYNYLVIPYWEEKNNQYQDSIDEKIKQLLSI